MIQDKKKLTKALEKFLKIFEFKSPETHNFLLFCLKTYDPEKIQNIIMMMIDICISDFNLEPIK